MAAARLTLNDHIEADTKVEFKKNYQETITALTSATTIAVDCSLSSIFSITLSHNANFVLSNLLTGGSVSIIITQDTDSVANTGTFYSSDSTAVKFLYGINTLSTANGQVDVCSIFNDGTNLLGILQKDFA